MSIGVKKRVFDKLRQVKREQSCKMFHTLPGVSRGREMRLTD